jgi:hypothetical protein
MALTVNYHFQALQANDLTCHGASDALPHILALGLEQVVAERRPSL